MLKIVVLPQRFDVSRPVDLEAGQHYFIDALQASQPGKRDSIKIGVVMPSGKSSFPIRKDLLSQFPPSKIVTTWYLQISVYEIPPRRMYLLVCLRKIQTSFYREEYLCRCAR